MGRWKNRRPRRGKEEKPKIKLTDEEINEWWWKKYEESTGRKFEGYVFKLNPTEEEMLECFGRILDEKTFKQTENPWDDRRYAIFLLVHRGDHEAVKRFVEEHYEHGEALDDLHDAYHPRL